MNFKSTQQLIIEYYLTDKHFDFYFDFDDKISVIRTSAVNILIYIYIYIILRKPMDSKF